MSTVLLPPGVNPIAVNKYININITIKNSANDGKNSTMRDLIG
jgi:hypothetical protein